MNETDFGDDWDDNVLNGIAQVEASAFGNHEENSPKPKHLQVLKNNFGHQTFRPMQWKIIDSILTHKKDNCAIMSTGYGKSLCFQYPSVFTGGVTFVISPLISLMEDQVLALTVANIPACLLGTANKEQAKTVEKIGKNYYRLVYLTPEFCGGDYGKELLQHWGQTLPVTLLAIDEAHCVSSWGHDFRTSYRYLGNLRSILPHVPILAVTATATQLVTEDIVKSLKLRNPQFSRTSFDRPNFYFAVKRKTDLILNDLKTVMECENGQWKFVGSTIVYTITRKNTEKISDMLSSLGIKCAPYHAGLTLKQRKETHEKYVRDKLDVVVATIAFGMGIDKPDVRNVIHYGVSNSIESYYQEVGRAGRDGQPAKCICFYCDSDFKTHRFLMAQTNTASHREKKEKILTGISNYVNSYDCRRKYILSYFGEKFEKPKSDNCCDNCSYNDKLQNNYENYEDLDQKGNFNFSKDARLFLSAVAAIPGNFGLGTYIDFLRGSKREKLKKFVNIPLHGAGRDKPDIWWKELGQLLIRNKLLSNKACSFNSFAFILEITDAGKSFLHDTTKELILVPTQTMLGCLKAKNNIWQNKSDSVVCNTTSEPSTKEKSEENMELYRLLLEVRAELAATEDCMPYMIASNRTLMDMARLQPQNLKEMEDMQFDGFPSAKIKKFGQKLLNVIPKTNVTAPILERLKQFPLPESQNSLNSSAISSYTMCKMGKNIKEIAKERSMAISTIETHLTNCLKFGYEIKLSLFNIDKNVAKTIITGILEANAGLTVLTPIKLACPEEITFGQIRAFTTYLRIREHLNEKSLSYEEFDDPEYYYMYKQQIEKREENKNLDKLLEGLQNIQKEEVNTNENSNLSDDLLSNICHNLENKIQAIDEISENVDEPDKKKLKMDFSDLLDSPPRYNSNEEPNNFNKISTTSSNSKDSKESIPSQIQPISTNEEKKEAFNLPPWLIKKRIA
ncbi:bifunctional 3'-5' exonuclease/ATP-dependent helicase WRN-like isoform X1 [Diorhabda sublineata]|uniref:bifunctional 3'-5' exonuclease/ATP-dependent helicase WRN-like isoform X1 n=1 Tax=Diorhabda sublineata TaxID=1163346 RepID=UPI0024E0FE3E|nr:bifunctional 3'-5' exonuclease/ATP-dependent helicase WRN-like isoform X1 [Diorhabda sublineata]